MPASENITLVTGVLGILSTPETNNTTDHVLVWSEENNEVQKVSKASISGEGGGGVQSVTGTLVNDTDPANPVINIPVLEQVLDANNTANNVPIILQDSPAANETATFEYYRFSLNGDGKEAIFQPNQYTITDSLTNKSISATTDGLRVSTNGTGYGTNIANDNLTGEYEQSIQLPNVGETERTFAVGVSSGGVTSYSGNDGIIEIPSAAATNLEYTASGTNGVITNSNGAGVTIPAADGTNAGLLLPGDKNKLNNVPANTTSDLAGKLSLNAGTGFAYFDGSGGVTWLSGSNGNLIRADGSIASISTSVSLASLTAYTIATSDDVISSTSMVRRAVAILDYRTSVAQKTGTISLSGTGSATSFNIPHGMPSVPTFASVTPKNMASSGIAYVTWNATNITVFYSVAPTTGTNNLSLSWFAKI